MKIASLRTAFRLPPVYFFYHGPSFSFLRFAFVLTFVRQAVKDPNGDPTLHFSDVRRRSLWDGRKERRGNGMLDDSREG